MNKRLVFLLVIAIGIGTFMLIGVQVKWIREMARAEEAYFSHAVQVALWEVADEINRRETSALSAAEGDHPVHLFQSQHALLAAKPVHERVSLPLIDTLLRQKLRAQDILIPFECAVTDELGVLVFASGGFDNPAPDYTYSAVLFPDAPHDAVPYYLNVFLPDRHSHILRAIRWLVVLSTLLTLLITVTFIATLVVIFRQKQLSKIKSDFVHNITHELKTPITTISLAAEMLQDPHVLEDRRNIERLPRVIGSESRRLLHLVEQVLQSAIFERGKLKLSVKPVDVHRLIREVLTHFALQFDTLKVSVECRLEAPRAWVMADEVHLANVVSNLIENAIKYRKEKQPLRIVVRTEEKGKRLVLAVTDNGKGIDGRSAGTKHLFNQFYRDASAENSYRIAGFGLGLYYVKNIIETHHGRLFASGRTGEGSTFGFELPLTDER
jgi:signal transduction histidine kinase